MRSPARASLRRQAGFNIVYDKSYPPSTTDYSPIVRAIQATNPDIVYVASYPPDSVGMVKAANELKLKTKLFGGGMVGLQFAAIQKNLGPMLNGIVNYDFWVPAPTLNFPGIEAFLTKYQEKAGPAGVDPLGHYLPPWAYAYMQVLGQSVEATKGLDQGKLADYMHKTTFQTIVGPGQVRLQRRVGHDPRADGAVPRHQAQRPRAVQEGRQPRGALSSVREVRRPAVPLPAVGHAALLID